MRPTLAFTALAVYAFAAYWLLFTQLLPWATASLGTPWTWAPVTA
jgi:hypothetical protein